jgi:release factor glutamine methyltransferase
MVEKIFMNIYEALEYGINKLKSKNIDEPIMKCRILLSSLLNNDKEYLIVHENEILDKEVESGYVEGIDLLLKGMPIQYITNKQEFMNFSFFVNQYVLIPQPDTEILVEEVINICNKKNRENENESNESQKNEESKIKILDLCTGSGAIGISILNNIKNSLVTLSDISNEALDVSNINIKNLVSDDDKDRIKTIHSDLFKSINDKFDIVVSNPPYIKESVIKNLSKEVQNEPIIALDGGEDGLKFYREIINKADKYLNDNGYLCLEIGYDQKEDVIDLIKNTNKYESIYSRKDLASYDRIVICRKIKR